MPVRIAASSTPSHFFPPLRGISPVFYKTLPTSRGREGLLGRTQQIDWASLHACHHPIYILIYVIYEHRTSIVAEPRLLYLEPACLVLGNLKKSRNRLGTCLAILRLPMSGELLAWYPTGHSHLANEATTSL